MTRPSTHIWRLLKWGRILARHGALRGIERDPNTPGPVMRLCRIARFGTIQPAEPDYAGAFREIGPAAIKLGQTLATRPDLVGDEAAKNLLSLQDSLPPVPFAAIRKQIEDSFERPLEDIFAEVDPEPVGAASIAQVHKGVTTDGRTVAIKVLRPGIREKFEQDIATYEWAAAHLEAMGGEAKRLRPRLTIANFKRWSNSELDFRREAASASELADEMRGVHRYESESGRATFDIVFDEDTEITGHMKLRLWVEIEEGEDADLFVAAQKLDADGQHTGFTFYAFYENGPVALGWLRASHRQLDPQRSEDWRPVHTHTQEDLLTPGEAVPVDIELWPSSTRFRAGETLRIVVQGSDIYTDSKPNLPFARHENLRNSGHHLIHTGGRYDSHLLAPIIPE